MASYKFLGSNYSWVDIQFGIEGEPIFQITEIKLETTQEVKFNYGAGNYPISRGYGNIDNKVSFKLSYEEVEKLRLIAPYKMLSKLPEFDLTITLVPNDTTQLASTIVCRQCRFIGDKFESKQGDTTIENDYELSCPLIDWGGGIPIS